MEFGLGLIGLLGLLGLLAVLALWAIGQYNMLVKLRNAVEEAFSTMDVYLKKRFDLVPNLVETVKGFAAHESGVLQAVTEARSMIQSATTTEQKIEGENMLTGALRSLFAVSEAYPDLKANQNFLDLQRQLNVIETDIAQSRKFYNGVVKQFNNRVEMFPSNIFANIFGFTRFPFFEVASEVEREAVAVSFA
ncbi:MAG: LemA family protein [Actinomycetia bacterium]|nr:LemA family protein [Actinomycetes bacterium]